MSIFDGIASTYDLALWPLEVVAFRPSRARLVKSARGRVLEIGAGTGANFAYYVPTARVYALDASAEMLQVARRRPCRACATVAQADGQRLPFRDDTFDTVVATLVLCSVPEPLRMLADVKRVLEPGGQLLLMDHTRGTHPITRWLTDAFHPAWYNLNGSCHLNRETARTVAHAGFDVMGVERHFGGVLQLIYAVKDKP